MKDTDHAWAAGVVDGDGCISIKIAARRYFHVSVVVGQSGVAIPKVLSKLKRMYGGSFCKAGQWTKRDQANGRMPKRNWQVVGLDAHRMLRKVSPYLVQRKSQAIIALKFREFVGKPGQRISNKNYAGQARLFLQIREHKNYARKGSRL